MADPDERSEPVERAGQVEREEPPAGLITVRSAAIGVALLWLAAMAGFGAVQASLYATRVAPVYAVVAVAAAALSLGAGYGSLRSFGLT